MTQLILLLSMLSCSTMTTVSHRPIKLKEKLTDPVHMEHHKLQDAVPAQMFVKHNHIRILPRTALSNQSLSPVEGPLSNLFTGKRTKNIHDRIDVLLAAPSNGSADKKEPSSAEDDLERTLMTLAQSTQSALKPMTMITFDIYGIDTNGDYLLRHEKESKSDIDHHKLTLTARVSGETISRVNPIQIDHLYAFHLVEQQAQETVEHKSNQWTYNLESMMQSFLPAATRGSKELEYKRLALEKMQDEIKKRLTILGSERKTLQADRDRYKEQAQKQDELKTAQKDAAN